MHKSRKLLQLIIIIIYIILVRVTHNNIDGNGIKRCHPAIVCGSLLLL